MNCEAIQRFRQDIYQSLGRAKDVVFELMDAVLVTRSLSSFAELSLCPVFRRQWSSLYEGLADSRPKQRRHREILVQQIPTTQRIIFAGDKTSWSRPTAPTLKDRGYEIGKSQISGREISLGHGYSTLAWIPEQEGSWALPLLHQRITSAETAQSKAAHQLRQVCRQLSQAQGQQRPLSLWDSSYGNGKFLQATAQIPCDKIIRLRSNLVLYNSPPAYQGKGRPRKHGTAFKLCEPSSWGEAQETICLEDSKRGELEVKRWQKLHFRNAAEIEIEVVRIEYRGKNLDRESRSRQVLWLAGVCQESLPLAEYELLYRRRFCLEHWYRFTKQRLHWTLPQFSETSQSERWSYLMPLLTWQLWLSRELVQDNPLPWQPQRKSRHRSPGQVAQGFGGLLAVIGSPTSAPKPRGKSPGWPQGRERSRRRRYPVVKKRCSRKKTESADDT